MRILIGGKWLEGQDSIEVRNPYDNSVIDTVPKTTAIEAEQALESAQIGARINRQMPVHQRATILYQVAQSVQKRSEEFARLIAMESGKTIREARKEVARAVNTLTVSAEESKRLLGETIPFDSMPGSEKRVGYYYRFPVGVVLAITPFNDPLNLVAHKVGPAIAGGNAVILKPATLTPLSALKLAEVFMECGLPPHVLNVITGMGGELSDILLADERVRFVSFTGGVETGKKIMAKIGLKKVSMELGSNSPVLVMEDADLSKAAHACVSGAFWAAGQNCIGVQRIYIQEEVYSAFKESFVQLARNYRVGYQLDEATDMGPMITGHEADRVISWVREVVNDGARVLTGGNRKGTLVEPTVMENVPPNSRLDCQEVFGPVVNLYPIKSLNDGIKRANAGPYGLHAAIFTHNLEYAYQAIQQLEAGSVIVNDSTDYRLDSMPFGGVKQSGLGREGIKFSLMEMTETKVVCFNLNQ